ncbi:MAG: ORF6N domain-containing protein [Chloroflexota bacterium]
MSSEITLAATVHIERAILVIRGQKVLLDADLAALYGVQTRVFLQSVRRHIQHSSPALIMVSPALATLTRGMSSDQWCRKPL